MPFRIVLDTSVLVAGLRSRRGASYRVLSLVGQGRFELILSVPLVLECEDVLLRPGMVPLEPGDVQAVLDYLCAAGVHQHIFYLWRPFLRDPSDDLVLELAVAGQCSFIITHNVRDFSGVERFGLRAVRPGEFLRTIGERSPGESP